MVTVVVSSNGLKFTVEEAKSAQATAYVEAKMFREFVFREETAVFKISLTTLLVRECWVHWWLGEGLKHVFSVTSILRHLSYLMV